MTKPNKIEAERQRLAQRIDEDIIASLRVLQTQTETYRHALTNSDATIALSVLSSLIHQVMQRTQHLRNNLDPTILETLGLEPALETFAAEARQIRGLRLTLQTPRLPQRLPYDIEMALFRTIETLVDHATAHASAVRFEIRLSQQHEGVVLHYHDDGRWLPSQTRILQALQTEIDLIDGTFTVNLTEEHTLQVTVRVANINTIMLTPREREVLQCIAEGMTNKDVASQLHLSVRTVSFHLDNAFSKLGANTRTEAVMIALQKGWIENPVK